MTNEAAPRAARSLASTVVWRLLAVLAVAMIAGVGAFTWLNEQISRAAQEQQLATTVRHFEIRFGELDYGWQLAAKNLRSQLAHNRILDAPANWQERLTAYLVSFADGIVFTHVLLVDPAGRVLFDYDPGGLPVPSIPKDQTGETGWLFAPAESTVYRQIALPMLVRGRSGHRLVLLVALDNVLLNANVYPGVEAYLLWQGKVVASSRGNAVLGLSASELAAASGNHRSAESAWNSEAGAPRLLLQQAYLNPVSLRAALLPFAMAGGLLALGGWLVLGGWLARLAARLDVLKQAARRFSGADRTDMQTAAAGIEASLKDPSGHDDLSDLASILAAAMKARLTAENELRRAQEELQRAYGENRAVTQAVHDNLFMVNPAGELVWWNRRVEDTTGLTPGQLLGMAGVSFFHEDDRTAVAQALVRAATMGYAEIEARLLTVDGPTDYQFNGVHVLDEAGRLLGVAGSGRDISERKRAEQALRIKDSAIAAAINGIAFGDLTGTLTYVNAAFLAMWGYERDDEVVGRSALEFWQHPEDAAQVLSKLATQDGWSGELVARRRDGSLFVTLLSATVIRDASGRPVQLMASFLDISERKRAEDEIRLLNTTLEQRVRARATELEAANKELEAFSYSVSHDLRAPLRAIDGFSRILIEDNAACLDADAMGNLNRIRSAVQRMGVQIDELLELSRVGRAAMRFTTVDLSHLAAEVVAQLRHGEPARTVEVDIAPGISAQGDARLLRQVLENLLGNAWKYTTRTAAAHIVFTAIEQDGQRVYRVSDNGAGFDMQYANQLFRAFQRLHTAREFPGAGIGLATVQRIIHRHGGRIWAEAVVGKGATFNFVLSVPSPG